MPTTKTAHPVDQVLSDIDTAEEMLAAAADDGAALSFEEITFLKSRLGWTDQDIRKQRTRIATVRRWQSISGTAKDREAMAQEAETAKQVYEDKAPKIEAEIEKLQQRLRSLENDRDRSAKRLGEMEEAAAKLKDVWLLPAHRRAEYLAASNAFSHGINRELMDVDAEIKYIGHQLNWDHSSPTVVYDHIRFAGRHFITQGARGWQVTEAWHEHVADIKKRLPELHRQRAELQAEFDRQSAELAAMLGVYVT